MAEKGLDLTKDSQHPQGNSVLNSARYSANNTDEWYTTYETIAEELDHYEDQFKGKSVLCNCDDPYEYNFCYYFLRNFNKLRLKKLVCTSFVGSKIDQIRGNEQRAFDLYDSEGNPVLIGQGYVLSVSKIPGKAGMDDQLERLHRYYWEVTSKKREKPFHPGESDAFLPEQIRGKHYNSWTAIAEDLGYTEDS